MSVSIRDVSIAINGKPIIESVDLDIATANASVWSARPVPANR